MTFQSADFHWMYPVYCVSKAWQNVYSSTTEDSPKQMPHCSSLRNIWEITAPHPFQPWCYILTTWPCDVFNGIYSLFSVVPRGAFTEQQLFGDVDSRLAGGITAMILLLFLSSVLILLFRTMKRRRRQRNCDEQAAVALGKHPNVVRTQSLTH